VTGLGTRTILGFAALVMILGAGVFVPAGTVLYWQAWVFIAVYLTSTLLITLYLWVKDRGLLERRLSAGPIAEKRKTQQVIMSFASLGFIALLALSAVDHRLRWTHVPSGVVILGDILILVGFSLEFFVFRANSFTSATVEVALDQRVVSTGPYAIVRHPMYAGGFLLLLGTPLALGSYWGLVALAAMMPVLIWRIVDEEKFLAKSLPGYREYQATVRYRLIPGVF
jgi:protein-S-isoprenylcysteine O-methyltransferase Ste14